MDLSEFDRHLACHDWFFDYSDDYSCWIRGNEQHKKLAAIAKESTIHNMLFDMWQTYHFDNGTRDDKRATLNANRALVLPDTVEAEA